jgi:ribonucleoside-diphosphate reductase beta chain
MIDNRLIPISEYKEPLEFEKKQLEVFWLPGEINVEKDVQDVLVNFTEAERHGVITTLKLFSLYETHAGTEYWGGRFRKIFNSSEFERMAACFSMFELCVHGPFYNKINELLHLNDKSFYTEYVNNPVLNARIEFIGEVIDDPDDLISLGVFSMVEGVILYSNFAFLKHFQSQGKNKALNIVRGINFSLRDENIHSQAGAWSFRLKKQLSNLSPEQEVILEAKIRDAARRIYEHECEIIKMIFEKGTIDGITEIQLIHFIKSRINECLKQLGYTREFNVTYNPIAETFYKAIGDYTFNDFFSGIGNQYHRNWDEKAFIWKKK